MRGLTALCALTLLFGLAREATASTLNLTAESVAGIARATGLLVGQEYMLARIEREFPDMAPQVDASRKRFDAAFSNAPRVLKAHLVEAMGADGFAVFETASNSRLAEVIQNVRLTRESAQEVLDAVDARASGGPIEDTKTAAYLYAAEYAHRPAGEFSAKHRQEYTTDGSGKALGVKLRLMLPGSWHQSPGTRPHVVSVWRSEGGTGMSMISLDVRETEAGYQPTRAELEDSIRPGGEIERLLAEVGMQGKRPWVFDHEKGPGYFMETTETIEHSGTTYVLRGSRYGVFLRGRSVGLSCAVGMPAEDMTDLEARHTRLDTLCTLVMNSLVFLRSQ